MPLPSSTEEAPPVVVPRGPGRPRDVRADRAILDATLELAGSVGLGGLTMDAVAAKAGVSKATIYRRWSSKESLVLDAWMACFTDDTIPDTGSVEGDLTILMGGLRDNISKGLLARVLPQMVAAAQVNEELAAAYRQFVAHRRRRTLVVLQRAIDRGELPAAIDLDLVPDMLVGPLFYRTLMSGSVSDDKVVATVVATVLAGARAQFGRS
jgi:AcrR family transcriptional regulator